MDQGPTHSDPALYVFGQTIRLYRKQRGLKQRELAALAKLDYTYVSEIERGKRNVTLLSLLRLAVALEVPLSCLLQPLETHPELFVKIAPNS